MDYTIDDHEGYHPAGRRRRRTIIKDGVQSGRLLQVTLAAGNLTRITGIEFQDGGRTNTKVRYISRCWFEH